MFDNITKLLRKQSEEAKPAPDKDRFAVAACVLLLEVAYSDDEFSEVERKTIGNALRERFSLNGPELEELFTRAEEVRDAAVDIFQFSQIINKEFEEPEKIKILEILWQVVYADGVVDEHEEFLMRKLSTLLDLNHTKMIDAKLKVRDGQ